MIGRLWEFKALHLIQFTISALWLHSKMWMFSFLLLLPFLLLAALFLHCNSLISWGWYCLYKLLCSRYFMMAVKQLKGIGNRKQAIGRKTVTIYFEWLWKTLELCTRKRVECCKQSLTCYSSRSQEESSTESNVDYRSLGKLKGMFGATVLATGVEHIPVIF